MELLKTFLLLLNNPLLAPYVVCALCLGVVGFALYVVLAVVKHGGGKPRR